MKVYLVRHGATYWNQRGLIQGNVDVGLTGEGEEQSRQAADKFPAERVFDLAVSPLRRARQTAEVLKQRLKIDQNWVLDGLREFDQGYWNGLPNDEVAEHIDPATYQSWQKDPLNSSPPAGETMLEVEERVNEAVDFLKENSSHPLILVAHKVVNSIVASLGGEWPLKDVLDSLPANAAVFEVRL